MTEKLKDRPKARAGYEEDFSAWLYEQADMIRAGRFADVDSENVAEELEGMARSEFRSLVSALRILMLHMLKWDFQAERRSSSWVESIRNQRHDYDDVLTDDPSLKPRREEALVKAYRRARLDAATETGLALDQFPPSCPYDWDQILTRSFKVDSASAQQ